ncbi:fimbrial protein [Stenotrophomonas lactitubi]|uniref:fimbrial protein n=1 Tax=Stenotrophomonas lactitubi TaxID=2045214 RepID=UPI0032095E84
MVLLAPLAASAADGTVTLKGKITEKTCTISTPGGRDFIVTLPTISLNALNIEGATVVGGGTAGRTPFAINLTNCAPGKVATYFEAGPTVRSDAGLLLNTAANRARNVDLQLLNSDGGNLRVKALGAYQSQNGSRWVEVGPDGTANLNYYVQYYSYPNPTAGEVKGSVNYTIMYN